MFEIDILEKANEYVASTVPKGEEYEPDPESLLDLSKAWDAFEREMEISQRVKMLTMEEINVGEMEVPRP